MAPTIVSIVALIRTFVPFTILRWPLAGAILAVIADAADVMIFQAFKSQFGSGLFSPAYYHNFDKFFDIYNRLAENPAKNGKMLPPGQPLLYFFFGVMLVSPHLKFQP